MKKCFYYIVPPVVVLLLWLAALFLIPSFIEDPELRGQFGDSFGAVNALFSGLALAGIVLTLIMQRQELALQREELKLTREEMKRSSDALNSQVDLMVLSALIQGYQNEMINVDEMRSEDPLSSSMISISREDPKVTQHKRDLRLQINSLFEQIRNKLEN